MTETMYAPYHYPFHDPSAVASGGPPPPPLAPAPGSSLGQPSYPHPGDMNDPNAMHSHPHPHHYPHHPYAHHPQPHHPHAPHPAHHHHHHHHQTAPRLPALQVHPSKLRSRRDMDSPAGKSSAPPLINPANMTPEEEAAAREEARKARKREMGRERQRRKRLRDKAKREAEKAKERMEAAGYMSEGVLHPSAMQIPFGSGVKPSSASRPSLSSLSVGSYDSVHSSSSTHSYSALPPMAMAPMGQGHNSLAMSTSSTSYSDASSPSQQFSPTLSATNSISGFTSDSSSWNEHAAVFSNLSLSGDADATVRVKAPRASISQSLRNLADRRPSDPDFSTISRRRKSDFDGDHSHIGLASVEWQTRGAGASSSSSTSRQRRPVSVPDSIVLESVHGPSRSPSPPPPLVTDMPATDYRSSSYSAASPEGMYFANSVVQGLNETQWGGMLHAKLGIQQHDLDRMSPDFAGVYDRWRVENNMTQYFLDPDTRAQVLAQQSPLTSPRAPGGFAMQQQLPPRHDDRPVSSASSASFNAPTGTMHLGQAHPATPSSRHGHSSTATSPVQPGPSAHTPAGHPAAMFPPADHGHQWSSAAAPPLARPYDPDWQRGGSAYGPPLSSPMSGEPKDNFHMQPLSAQHPQIAVQTAFVNAAPEFQSPSAGPSRLGAPFAPATPLSQRGHNMSAPPGNVPLFYNPQFHQPPMPPHTPVSGQPAIPQPVKEEDVYLPPPPPPAPQQ